MSDLFYWKNLPGLAASSALPSRQNIFDAHEQIINKFYDDFFGNRKHFNVSNSSYPKMDITEDGSNLYVKCAVPGVSEEDLSVETNKDSRVLTIKGQTSEIHKMSNPTYAHIRDLDSCEADLKDGILSLTFKINKQIPEIIEDKVKKIPIKKS
jgi:HSP20 family molecular chaperone IbpA